VPTIRILTANESAAAVPALADILMDVVMAGASVSFQPPLKRERAEAFWRKIADGVAAGAAILLVAEHEGRMVGTVQVQFAMIENQPHRADIAKMLVHTSARRLGIGAALMRAAETAAREAGRTLLTLDTVTGSAGERLYARLGWTRVGIIPGYALTPYDGLCDTTIFYKRI
jgi:GNAT superfamily N-acetyltransferase